MIGTIQKLSYVSAAGIQKEQFVKSDRSLGSNVQETVRGIFLNVARVETYVKRVIYIELLNGKLWFRHPRSSVGERRVFDPTGPKVLQNPGGKRVLFW